MEMAQFDDWLDGINTNIASSNGSASNIPRVVVVHAVRSVVRDFLTETHIWVYQPKNIIPQGERRLLMIPRDTYICKLWPMDDKHWLSDQAFHIHPNIVDLSDLGPSRSDKESIEGIKVSLSVTQSSLECPMFIYDRYYDAILSGTLATLQVMPGKAWSEPNIASHHKAMFNAAILKAEADMAGMLNIKKQNTSIPPNFT